MDSCFKIDEKGIGPSQPKYSKFHVEFDVKDPHFENRMKFSSFS